MAEWSFPRSVDDKTHLAFTALLPFAGGSPLIAEHLVAAQEPWLAGTRNVVLSFVARNAHLLHVRDNWNSIDDFAVFANRLFDVLGQTAWLHQVRGGDGYGFDPELWGKALRAVVGSMIQLHDEDEHPLDAQYRRLHERRSEAGDD